MTRVAGIRFFSLAILTLALLAMLKIANVWIGFSSAGAEENAPVILAENENTGAAAAAPQISQAAAPPGQPSEVERRILEKLAARRASLEARERQIETREALLAAAEKRLEVRFSDFAAERGQLEAIRAEQMAGEMQGVSALVSAYEKMKPKDAARIFDALDEDVLVPLASGMRTNALAGVLADMAPENARRLTRLLAERNKTAPAPAPSTVR